MKFTEVSKFFEKIESVSSRNEMAQISADFLKTCDEQEAQILSYLMLGRVAPLFVNAEFNYSEKSLANLISSYTKEDVAGIRRETGDIGDTVMKVWEKHSKNASVYSLSDIYEILWKIINTKGIGSVQSKGSIILECLQKLSPLESKYFVRIICGELRLGLNARSLLDVYSIYLAGDKGLKKVLEHAYGVCTDIGYIAGVVVSPNATEKLSNMNVRPGTPILSRLVERVGSFEEVFERIKGSVIVQPKFDGLRCQIHKWSREGGGTALSTIWSSYMSNDNKAVSLFGNSSVQDSEIRLFTRNLEDVTEMFPEIVESARNISLESFVLDSEVMGWDYSKDRFMSYQETMQRRRKYLVTEKKESIPVKAFVFDILYLNGKSLLTEDTKLRVETVQKELKNTNGGIQLAESVVVSDTDEIKEHFRRYVDNGLEGIIIKQFEGGYKPGIRNFEWLKIKRSIEKELVDTVDMAVVGYYYGSGRRAGLGLGAILCGIRNEKEESVDVICKVGTGLNDKMLRDIREKLEEIRVDTVPKNVKHNEVLIPDVWVEPKYVVTVDADEITKNISKSNKNIGGGLSLRFPRLIEFGRDKLLEDITTVAELESMYKMRKST